MSQLRLNLAVLALGLLLASCAPAATPVATSLPPPTEIQPTITPAPPTATTAPLATVTTTATLAPTATSSSTPPAVSPTPGPVKLVETIQGGSHPFIKVSDFVIDSQGNLYVADVGNSRIEKFDSHRNFVAMWGKVGAGEGEFTFERKRDHLLIGGIDVDSQGDVYVAEAGGFRIQKFDPTGKFLAKWGSEGTKDGQFVDVIGVGVNRQGNVYAIDDGRDVIQKFDSNGKFLMKFGGPGQGDGQLNDPGWLTVDPLGNVWVADGSNHRVEEFDGNGKFLQEWHVPPCEPDKPNYPQGIVVDAHENVYVASFNDETQPRQACAAKFNSKGTLLYQWGSYGRLPGEFISSVMVRLDAAGAIYVGDADVPRIQVFVER